MAINAGTGDGAHAITVTIEDDSSTALENATVRFAEGVNSWVGTTDASGNVSFALDSATYTVTITKPGYDGQITSQVVAAAASQTWQLIETVVTPSASAQLSTGTLTVYDEHGVAEQNVSVSVQLTAGPGDDGYAWDTAARTATSDENGLIEFTGLVRGATYTIWRGTSPTAANPFAQRSSSPRTTFVVPNAASFSLPEVTGAES